MATPITLAGSCAIRPPATDGLRYVARQPILDLRNRVHGYELLFRKGPEQIFRGDGNLATRTMLDNSVMFGLDRLTAGMLAFVNCTRESLLESLVRVLPSAITVLEVLETIEPTPPLLQACRQLKSMGYRLALDDFTWRPGIEPFVELADYIKIDFLATGPRERHELLNHLNGAKVALLAEKVETQEQYAQACDQGFSLIQGYYFCRPTLLQNHKLPVNRLTQIDILRALQEDPVDLSRLAVLIKRDASLTYRLLRLINSPVCAMRQEVSSVLAALLAVGEDVFRRMALLAITSELNTHRPTEILRMAFVRGQFCELAAPLCALNSAEQYLLGLFSLLPAMLRVPMAELTPLLPLREPIRQALHGAEIPERSLLAWAIAHEYGDWQACDALVAAFSLDEEKLSHCYAEAVEWTEAALQFA
jgi:c-di-GMP-related signal transduction protein